MADSTELARYVRRHPRAYEHRWRLAKKLYAAWEYKDALEHLQVLRKEWEPRINVSRYLAATYFRLGRYDEAIGELNDASRIWPEELGLQEQLAKVYEAAGRKDAAAATWRNIRKRQPDHALAGDVESRLMAEPGAEGQEELSPSDGGFGPEPRVTCPVCQAENSAEFDRCWQCHSPLGQEPEDDWKPGPPPLPRSGGDRTGVWALVLGGIGLVALGVALYVAFSERGALTAQRALGAAPADLYGFFVGQAWNVRTVVGLGAAIVWPLALWWLGGLLGAPWPHALRATVLGLMLAALTYAALWFPLPYLAYALLVPGVLALALAGPVLRLRVGRGLAAGALSAVLAAGVVFGPIAGMLGPDVVAEWPAIVAYAASRDAQPERTRIMAPGEDIAVLWHSTGSSYVDEEASTIALEVWSGRPGLEVQLLDDDGREIIDLTTGPQHRFGRARVVPEAIYRLRTGAGPDDATIHLRAIGVLDPRFDPPEASLRRDVLKNLWP
jgi:tetratricopeptide (TPR) repeat protein